MRGALAILLILLSLGAWAASDAELVDWMRKAMHGDAAARASLEQTARAGDANAAHLLGHLYLRGQGVPRSEAMAIEWFERAAKEGHVESMHNLGVLYERALKPSQNLEAARRWYRAAAEAGFARAQANLGQMLLDGAGGAADPLEARRWRQTGGVRLSQMARHLLRLLRRERMGGAQRQDGVVCVSIKARVQGRRLRPVRVVLRPLGRPADDGEHRVGTRCRPVVLGDPV